jgi:ribose transport system ATP-binding protein
MVEIAKALIFDAKLIILDEPTSALLDSEVQKL